MQNVFDIESSLVYYMYVLSLYINSLCVFIIVGPLSVSLLNRPQQMIAGAASTIRCVSEGSRPPAQITWYKDNRSFSKDMVSTKY